MCFFFFSFFWGGGGDFGSWKAGSWGGGDLGFWMIGFIRLFLFAFGRPAAELAVRDGQVGGMCWWSSIQDIHQPGASDRIRARCPVFSQWHMASFDLQLFARRSPVKRLSSAFFPRACAPPGMDPHQNMIVASRRVVRASAQTCKLVSGFVVHYLLHRCLVQGARWQTKFAVLSETGVCFGWITCYRSPSFPASRSCQSLINEGTAVFG